jgi:hypothetical protein
MKRQRSIVRSAASLLLVAGATAPHAWAAPHKESPISSSEVVFANDRAGARLVETLVLPQSAQRCPAVLLVTGSAQQDPTKRSSRTSRSS